MSIDEVNNILNKVRQVCDSKKFKDKEKSSNSYDFIFDVLIDALIKECYRKAARKETF